MFTAIISDLHLCEAEPVNDRFPLWKKYKTKEFFFDHTFRDFLSHIEEKAGGEPVELILNGDIFDFDSVLSIPEKPNFHISWLEKKRGLFPRPERSKYKMQVIIDHHPEFFDALSEFIERGHSVVLIAGNHDVELHYADVREVILKRLKLRPQTVDRFRFCEWFYISNGDTLIEHGNQYDPYCVCEDPVNPFSQGYNYKTIRLPFGNLACRFILNGMAFFNPHVDSNYIMSVPQYIKFFFKYVARAQPLLIWTWLWGAMATLWQSLNDRLEKPIREPLRVEDRIESIAFRAKAEPRQVRELRELFVDSATGDPFLIARELWLDRAFLILMSFLIILQAMLVIKQLFDVSFFWALIPLLIMLPFFLFYSQSVVSMVSSFKEPNERILAAMSAITNVKRVVFGHTHHIRHEMIGAVEHLNSGCWSPAFLDVECTKAIDQKTFVWIFPETTIKAQGTTRRATLYSFRDGKSERCFQTRDKVS